MTPGNAMVGYAVLKANYNEKASNYLDNFSPFVLAVLAASNQPYMERHAVAEQIRAVFGIAIPTLVLPRLLRRTKREGLTEPVGSDAIRLTEKGAAEVPDLSAELADYRRKQGELVHEFEAYVRAHHPDHVEHLSGDLGAHLAEFFDRQSVPLLNHGLRGASSAGDASAGSDYLVASFVSHLAERDQMRFSYVVEAAKGAMLASILVLDTSGMKDALSDLRIVLDTPVVMDALGFHGELPCIAISQVLSLARDQGAQIVMFEHSASELDGILDAVEHELRRGGSSRSTGVGYLHFVEARKTPADIAVIRGKLEAVIEGAGIRVIERPNTHRQYGLDEVRLEEAIQKRVHYAQDAARINDVHSLSATHRLREGRRDKALERSKAVLVSSNDRLVRGAMDFKDEGSLPLAITTEALASMLWVRSPATAPDVPREMLLASAFVGMQPRPSLWTKYLAEVEALEASGGISADDAVVLRSTRVGRDALMQESLGDPEAMTDELPGAVLDRVRGAIEAPLEQEVSRLREQVAHTDEAATHAAAGWIEQAEAREAAELSAKRSQAERAQLQRRLDLVEKADQDKRRRIRGRAADVAKRWVRGVAWSIRAFALLGTAWAALYLFFEPDPSSRLPVIIVGLFGLASFAAPFLPKLDRLLTELELRLTIRGERRRLQDAGYELDAPEMAKAA